jgi:CubicO group peptidase (beta-lactamase class C family)
MLKGIEEKTFPGGVLLIGKQGKVIYHKPFGKFTYEPSSTIMTENALFDLSSLTQPAATNTAAMLLYDEGKLKLNEKVSYYLPDFGNNGKENISVKDLLVNHSDLNTINANINDDRNSFIKSIMNLNKQEFNSKRYLNMIVLQLIIEKVSEQSLDKYLKEKLFYPLNLEKTQYNPPKVLWYYTPPTSDIYSSEKRNKGVVYDTVAFIMNGVAGHSGLFSTAKELAVFAQLFLQNGKYHNKQWIKTSTIEEWIRFYNSDQTNSSDNQFLFSGETGTSLLINKKYDMFVILLTNSIYPGWHINKIDSFRNSLYKHIYESIEY